MFSPKRGSRIRSLTAILSLIFCFCGTLTFADPYFYVRKKIPAHTQTATPSSTSDANVIKETSPVDKASNKPSLDVSPSDSPAEPASVFTEETPAASTSETAPDEREVIPGLPPEIHNAAPLKTEKVTPKAPISKAAVITPQSHQTVQFPMPETKPEPSPVPERQPMFKTPIIPTSGEKEQNIQPSEEVPAIRSTPQTVKSKHLQASAKKAAPQAQPRSKEKPLVHFPKDLLPAPASDNQTAGISNRKQNAVFVPKPKGYKPFAMPKNSQQAAWHQEAMQSYELGNMMGRENQIQNAVSAYQKALQRSPNFADAYIGLSTAYILQNNWEDVLYNAQKGLSLRQGFMDPSNITRAQYNLSVTYCVMDNYGKAKQYYEKVKKTNYPLSPQLWNYLQQNCKR